MALSCNIQRLKFLLLSLILISILTPFIFTQTNASLSSSVATLPLHVRVADVSIFPISQNDNGRSYFFVSTSIQIWNNNSLSLTYDHISSCGFRVHLVSEIEGKNSIGTTFLTSCNFITNSITYEPGSKLHTLSSDLFLSSPGYSSLPDGNYTFSIVETDVISYSLTLAVKNSSTTKQYDPIPLNWGEKGVEPQFNTMETSLPVQNNSSNLFSQVQVMNTNLTPFVLVVFVFTSVLPTLYLINNKRRGRSLKFEYNEYKGLKVNSIANICNNCGKIRRDNGKFCSYCGSKEI